MGKNKKFSEIQGVKNPKVILPDLEPITCIAVTVFKHAGRINISDSLELTIVNGVVISTRSLNRAQDTNNMSISKCSKRLWEIIKEQTLETVFGLKAGGAVSVKSETN